MDWKVLGGLAAIWSASAGLAVSTEIVSLPANDIGAVWSFEGGGPPPPVTTVVIDTARSHVTSLPDVSPEHGGAHCGDALGAFGCMFLPSAQGVTLTIFGQTVLAPTDWYGFDNPEAAYMSAQPLSLPRLMGGRSQFIGSAVWKEATRTGSNTSDEKSKDVPSQQSDALPVQSEFPLTFQIEGMRSDLAPATPADVGPVEPPLINQPKFVISADQGISIPESSTWAMLLIGFAGLGLAALLRSRRLLRGAR